MSSRLLDDAALKELLELEREHGRLTPEIVLERARSHNSALHRYFEWNDAEAAHRYRLEQARSLIRAVRISVVVEERVVVAPRFVARDTQYREITTMRGTEDGAAVLSRELRAALGHLRRAAAIADVLGETEASELARAVAIVELLVNAREANAA